MKRAVLDTNIWLDWLLFREPGVAHLRAMHAEGRLEILIDEACEAELARVLAYDLGRHSIDAAAQAALLAECRRISTRVGIPAKVAVSLPRCRDPDDQKFLELSAAAEADALITKDRALLELRRKLPFTVLQPDDFR